MSDLDADLYLAPETRCGMYGHVIRPGVLGLACLRCGTQHACTECSGLGEHWRTGLCRACDGLGCRCGSSDEHDYVLQLVAYGKRPTGD